MSVIQIIWHAIYVFFVALVILGSIIKRKTILKQLSYAVFGLDNKMSFKELVSFSLLLLTIFMTLSRAFMDIVWEQFWVYTIPGSLIMSVFGNLVFMHHQDKIKK